jgi:hypothetical protein
MAFPSTPLPHGFLITYSKIPATNGAHIPEANFQCLSAKKDSTRMIGRCAEHPSN